MAENPVDVLLVEDDDSHARIICRIFGSHSLPTRITVASTIREAQARLAQTPPDLIFCDLQLPDGTGRDLLPGSPEARQIPIVLMTSYGDEQTAVEAMKLGAMDYVVKSQATLEALPHLAQRVLREWEHLTQRRRAEKELAEHRENLEELVLERTAELEQTNAALADAIAATDAANRAKTDFLANMSHEIRTPLHGLLSYAAFGVKHVETAPREKLLEYFQKVDRSGNVLLKLLGNLLDLTKLESAKMPFDFAKVNLGELVRLAQDELGSMAVSRGITLEGPNSAADLLIVADQERIMQVLRNLLSNAVKFSPDNSTISISTGSDGQSVRVGVHDAGVGIPEDELEAVFNKFFQSSKTRYGAGGTGLGLSICREIIYAHRGRIWAESRLEDGASFVFEIPINPYGDMEIENVPSTFVSRTALDEPAIAT